MVLLKSGIEVSQPLIDALLKAESVNIRWETIDDYPHLDIQDTQHRVFPRSVNHFELPVEPIAYYVETRCHGDDLEGQKGYCVVDCSEHVEVGRPNKMQGLTTPVPSKEAAEDMVIDALRRFVKSDLAG